jgi:methionyl aminopeptidase
MITYKSAAEFEKMAVAGRCVARIHEEVRAASQPGVTLLELDAISARVLGEEGCTSSFLGYHGTYPATICASVNDQVVHGIPSKYKLREGDILSLDVGAIFEGFHGDAALTYGIGEIDPKVQLLLDVTEAALWAGIDQVENGARVGDIGAAVEAVAAPHGFGVVTDYVGHGIGRQMHEQPQIPNYGRPGSGVKLKTGMALCIEPMFNLGTPDTLVESDGWTVVTADRSPSAHFEHTIAITEDGPKVFTVSEALTARPA